MRSTSEGDSARANPRTATPREYQIFPFLHSLSNHLSTEKLLTSVLVPDVVPAEILANVKPGGFSLVAGDFEEVYGPSHWSNEPRVEGEEDDDDNPNQYHRFGAVVTCFFIDTARNILNYLRIIHGLLDDGGVWINLGPLLWHFENAGNSAKGEGSVELCLDEVKELARIVGFEIKQERMVRSAYTGVPDGMLEHVYNVSNNKPTLTPVRILDGHQDQNVTDKIQDPITYAWHVTSVHYFRSASSLAWTFAMCPLNLRCDSKLSSVSSGPSW